MFESHGAAGLDLDPLPAHERLLVPRVRVEDDPREAAPAVAGARIRPFDGVVHGVQLVQPDDRQDERAGAEEGAVAVLRRALGAEFCSHKQFKASPRVIERKKCVVGAGQ